MHAVIETGLRRLGRRMLVTLLYMLGLALLVAPFALLLPPTARMVVGALIWLGGSAFAVGRYEQEIGGWAIILAAVPAMTTAIALPDVLLPLAGRHVAGISAADAPRYPDAQGFDFSDSLVQTAYAASYRHTTRDRKSGRISYTYYNIAPLTAAGWTPTDPVPAWVGCSDTYDRTCPEWRRAYRGAVSAPQIDQQHLRTAADQILAAHGLREAPGAPLLSRVESAAVGARERAGTLLIGFVFSYLVWLAPALAGLLLEIGAELLDHLGAAWARLRDG